MNLPVPGNRVVLLAGDVTLMGDVTRVLVRAGTRVFLAAPDARAIGAIVAAVGHNSADGSRAPLLAALAHCLRRFGRCDLLLDLVAVPLGGDVSEALAGALERSRHLEDDVPGVPMALLVLARAREASLSPEWRRAGDIAEAVDAFLGNAPPPCIVVVSE